RRGSRDREPGAALPAPERSGAGGVLRRGKRLRACLRHELRPPPLRGNRLPLRVPHRAASVRPGLPAQPPTGGPAGPVLLQPWAGFLTLQNLHKSLPVQVVLSPISLVINALGVAS